MTKRLINFILSFVFGVLCLSWSIRIIIQDIGFDITKANSIIGQVLSVDIIRPRGEFKYAKRLFYFKLDNSEQQFTIYHPYEGYHELESEIKTGDTLKVYYRPKLSGYNRNVYQVEKNGIIIENYKTYYENSSTNAMPPLIVGVLTIIASLMTYYKINLWMFLTSLVEPRKKND